MVRIDVDADDDDVNDDDDDYYYDYDDYGCYWFFLLSFFVCLFVKD